MILKSKPYVSIDLETTGLNPESCQILEIGLVVDDWVSPIEELPTLRLLVEHKRIVGEPFALQMNQKILHSLAVKDASLNYVKAENACEVMAHWLDKVGINPKKIVAAGKNFASFDLQFLKRLPYFDDNLIFHHRSYDPAMWFMDFAEDELPPAMSTCMKRACIEGEVTHSAVEDAIVVVKLMRHILYCETQVDIYGNEKPDPIGVTHPASPLGQFLAATQEPDRPEPRNGY